MNMTTGLNTASQDTDTQEEANASQASAPQARLSSEGSITVPKKVKKSKEAFRTISEVANKLDVQQHVLRFWETKFSQVRPLKRGLYTEGYTIKGVQKLLKEQGKAQMIATQLEASNSSVATKPQGEAPQASAKAGVDASAAASQKVSDTQRAVLEIMLAELKAMRAMIKV